MIQVEDRRQVNGWTCGPVCAAVVLRWFDKPIPRSWPSNSSIDGTHPYAIVPVMRKRGLRVLAGSCTREILTTHVRNENPAICLVQLGQDSHYVVVTGVQDGYVYFHCPLAGPSRQPVKKFMESWVCDGDMPGEFFQFAILVWS